MVLSRETRVLRKKIICSAPPAFAKLNILGVKNWSGAELPAGVEMLLGATLWRAAAATIEIWPRVRAMLEAAADQRLPIVAKIEGRWRAPRWLAPVSIAQHLRASKHGAAFPACKGIN